MVVGASALLAEEAAAKKRCLQKLKKKKAFTDKTAVTLEQAKIK